MGNFHEKLGDCAATVAHPNSKEHRQQRGFIRAFARELLVHNPAIQTIEEALQLAESFTIKTWDDARTTENCHREVNDPSME